MTIFALCLILVKTYALQTSLHTNLRLERLIITCRKEKLTDQLSLGQLTEGIILLDNTLSLNYQNGVSCGWGWQDSCVGYSVWLLWASELSMQQTWSGKILCQQHNPCEHHVEWICFHICVSNHMIVNIEIPGEIMAERSHCQGIKSLGLQFFNMVWFIFAKHSMFCILKKIGARNRNPQEYTQPFSLTLMMWS